MKKLEFHFVIYLFIYFALLYDTFCTIDINLSQLEYLAARLDPFECRRLIAVLHYMSYDLPMNLAAAGKLKKKREKILILYMYENIKVILKLL